VSGLDLHLPAGRCTALVGESGSGKTTVVRLVTGLARPDSGTVLVDGRDLAQLHTETWHRNLALLSQRPVFFAGTVAENLLLGCGVRSKEQIQAALESAGAASFVGRLPDGLETRLGDRGAGLSGGELRRLALARLFLRDVPLIVLDEPTAGLDRENELLVVAALECLIRGRTTLLISHREETLALAGQTVSLVSCIRTAGGGA
jgi:ATP-binding cassette subfamily C protein CydD